MGDLKLVRSIKKIVSKKETLHFVENGKLIINKTKKDFYSSRGGLNAIIPSRPKHPIARVKIEKSETLERAALRLLILTKTEIAKKIATSSLEISRAQKRVRVAKKNKDMWVELQEELESI